MDIFCLDQTFWWRIFFGLPSDPRGRLTLQVNVHSIQRSWIDSDFFIFLLAQNLHNVKRDLFFCSFSFLFDTEVGVFGLYSIYYGQ